MSFDSAVPASPNIFSSRMKRRRGWGERGGGGGFFFYFLIFFFLPFPCSPWGAGRGRPRSISWGASSGMLTGGRGAVAGGEDPS